MNDAIGVFLLIEYNFICYNPNGVSIILDTTRKWK